MTSPGVGSGALLAAWFFLATNSLRASSDFSAETASFALIWDFLSPTRHREDRHREPSFPKPVLTRTTHKANDSRSTRTGRTLQCAAHRDLCIWLTSKMSHDGTWRASCRMTIFIPSLHFESTLHRTRRDKSRRWLWRLVSNITSCAEPGRVRRKGTLVGRRHVVGGGVSGPGGKRYTGEALVLFPSLIVSMVLCGACHFPGF